MDSYILTSILTEPPLLLLAPSRLSPTAEVMAQYYKLYKKVKTGADFVITQLGYDARKFDELLRFMHHHGIRIPILGNVYVLNQRVAKVMNQGKVPGCVVTNDLYRIYEEEAKSPDKGQAARLTRAAKLISILKEIGYDGVHIGGPNLSYEDVEEVIEKSKDFSSRRESLVDEFSFPQADGFYLFEKNPKTGLNTDIPLKKKRKLRKPVGYAIMRFLHHSAFTKEAPLFKPARCDYKKLD